MKRRVVIERNDSRLNETIECDTYYKAWMTYYNYKDKIGYGREWSNIIINVRLE
jgi:hypothetical protein